MAAGKTILVVDDDPDIVETTKAVLETAGYDIVTASDGKEALAKAKSAKPDLVVLDIMMERETDGFHVAYEMKSSDERSTSNHRPDGRRAKKRIPFRSRDRRGLSAGRRIHGKAARRTAAIEGRRRAPPEETSLKTQSGKGRTMLPKIIKKRTSRASSRRSSEHNSVVAPVKKDSKYAFAEIERFEDMSLTYDTTMLSPKKYFFPQEETVLNTSWARRPPRRAWWRSSRGRASSSAYIPATSRRRGCWTWSSARTRPTPTTWRSAREALLIGYNCGQPCDKYFVLQGHGDVQGRVRLRPHAHGPRRQVFRGDGHARGRGAPHGVGRVRERLGGRPQGAAEIQRGEGSRFVKRIPYDTRFLPEILDASTTRSCGRPSAGKCFSCGACT